MGKTRPGRGGGEGPGTNVGPRTSSRAQRRGGANGQDEGLESKERSNLNGPGKKTRAPNRQEVPSIPIALEDVDDDALGATATMKDDLMLLASCGFDDWQRELDKYLEAEANEVHERSKVKVHDWLHSLK